MTRAVLDANVLVSAFLVPGGVSDKALSLCLSGVACLVTSETLLEELTGVLRDKLRASPGDIRSTLALIRRAADVVQPAIVVEVITADPDDNAVLECAIWGEADVVVTGDKAHLLLLKSFRNIPIIGPRQFVERFS